MAFAFREDYPVLGSNVTVDVGGGNSNASGTGPGILSSTAAPKVQAFEFQAINGLGASSANQTVWVAPANQFGTYRLEGATVTWGTASTSGTLMIEKATSTQAIGSGTNLFAAATSLSSTANTPVNSNLSGISVTTLTMAPGDRLNFLFTGTMTGLANCTVNLVISRQ